MVDVWRALQVADIPEPAGFLNIAQIAELLGVVVDPMAMQVFTVVVVLAVIAQQQQHQRIQQYIGTCLPPTCMGRNSSISKRAEHEASRSRPGGDAHNMSPSWAYDSEN